MRVIFCSLMILGFVDAARAELVECKLTNSKGMPESVQYLNPSERAEDRIDAIYRGADFTRNFALWGYPKDCHTEEGCTFINQDSMGGPVISNPHTELTIRKVKIMGKSEIQLTMFATRADGVFSYFIYNNATCR